MLTSNSLFFVVCDSRSGSTMLARWIAERGDVVITPETNFVTDALSRYPRSRVDSYQHAQELAQIVFSDPKFSDLGLARPAVERLLSEKAPMLLADALRRILDLYRVTILPSASKIGVKKGSYVFHWPELVAAFSDARFVGIVRDGRAVFASKKRSIYSVTGEPFETNPRMAARRWVETVQHIEALERSHPHVLVVRYEDLVTDRERAFAEVSDFLALGLAKDSARVSPFVIPHRYDSALHQNVFLEPIQDRESAWRNELTEAEVGAYEAVAGEVLEQQGYALVAHEAEAR